ncbi:MAG TPA: hypothetical protein VFG07_10630 [Thermoplasmata archaeon]|nr:hypothetical protein [Thermoplasmata archaeon]
MILFVGVALIFIPPHGFGLGVLLLILSSAPFSLAYSHSMRAVRQLSH